MGEAARSDPQYDLASPFLLAKDGTRAIELQPTRRCNLRCRHCYSRSGPDERDDLPYEPLARFMAEAKDLGFNYVGVSGGEPLLWRDLDRFLDLASGLGFATAITTNGTLLTRARAATLHGRAGVVAVSVDGTPDEHARIRGSETAFDSMRRGLEHLATERVPFALAFTLTRYNADQLTWLFEFARNTGAIGLHVHPLCEFGAAVDHLSGAAPDSQEFRAAGWLLALLAQEYGSPPAVTMDAISRKIVEQSCWALLKLDFDAPFHDLVPSLVVETDGAIVPYIYGFPRHWHVGRIGQGDLAQAAVAWKARCAESVSEMVRSTLSRLREDGEEYIDLFGQVLRTALAPKHVS